MPGWAHHVSGLIVPADYDVPVVTGWLPSDLASTVMWYEPRYANSVTTSSSSVTGLSNLVPGGSAFDMAQSNGANEPTYSAPVIDFDGNSDFLQGGTSKVSDALISVGIRFRWQGTLNNAAGNSMVTCVQGSGANIFFELTYTKGVGGAYVNGYSFVATATSVAGCGVTKTTDSNWHWIALTFDGVNQSTPSSWRMIYDGTEQTVTTSGSIGQTNFRNSLGARYNNGSGQSFAPMEIGCVVVAKSTLVGGDLTDLCDYLRAA